MKIKEFYQNNWAKEQPLDSMERCKKVMNILENKKIQRMLDIECGEGDFCLRIRSELDLKEVFGIDISEKAIKKAIKSGIKTHCLDVSEESLPFPGSFFDAIHCGEIIEHSFDPDTLLDEVYRVLKKGGFFIITTPNLASWYNRLVLMFGYQPFFAKVSTRSGVGHLFPFRLAAGHIRLFTLRALKEIVRNHNFKIEMCYGFGINTKLGLGKEFCSVIKITNFVLKPFPSLASDIMAVCTKVRTKK